MLTLDHFLARDSKGGNETTNLLTACYPCNSARQHKPALTFAHETETLFQSAPEMLDRILNALDAPLPAYVP